MKKIFALFAILSFSFSLSAQDSFEGVISKILDNNADLKSQRAQITAQGWDAADENALENPSVEFARVWGRHSIGNKLQLDISQSFEWPGVYSARSRAADMGINVAVAQYETARFELSRQARQLLTELVFVRHQIDIIKMLTDNFNNLSEAIDKGVRGGELTVLDQRKMQIEKFEIENDMANALAREHQLISDLNSLTTEPLDLAAIDDYPIMPLLSVDDYLAQVDSDPNVLALVLEAELEEQNATVATRSRMPGFSVGYQHQAEMGDRFNGFTVGMTVPVFKGRNAHKAALERKLSAELSREMIVAKRSAEIRGTYANLEIHRKRLDAYKTTFGDNKYLELLLKAYDGGQITVIDYLSELHYYHQTMLVYLETEYNYQLDLANLNCYE